MSTYQRNIRDVVNFGSTTTTSPVSKVPSRSKVSVFCSPHKDAMHDLRPPVLRPINIMLAINPQKAAPELMAIGVAVAMSSTMPAI
jgi:hypothetical protein